MFKKLIIPFSFVALLNLGLMAEEDKKEEVGFLNTAGQTELSDEQKAEAKAKMDEASKLYEQTLEYDMEGREKALTKSLEYINNRIAKTEKELAKREKQSSKIKLDLTKEEKRIKSREYDKKKEEQKLLDLTQKFSFEEGYITRRILACTKSLERLRKRRAELKDQLGEIMEEQEDKYEGGKKLSAYELELRKQQKDAEALRKKNEQELKDKRRSEILND